MYAAGRDHPHRGPCLSVLKRAAIGQLDAVTSAEVHQEILHRYLSLRLRPMAQTVSSDFQDAVPDVLPVRIEDIAQARHLSVRYPTLPARDLIHAAVMLNNGLSRIISADHHFDGVEGIRRIDPLAFGPDRPDALDG